MKNTQGKRKGETCEVSLIISRPGSKQDEIKSTRRTLNPLRPNNDLSQTSHCNIKGLSASEVMRIENMITQVPFY